MKLTIRLGVIQDEEDLRGHACEACRQCMSNKAARSVTSNSQPASIVLIVLAACFSSQLMPPRPGPRSQRTSRCARSVPNHAWKDLKNGSLAKLKNGMKLGAHERQGQFAEGWKRQRVLDAVADARRARVHLVKDVMVHPFSVRAFQLLINKLKRRVPAADSRPPPQRQTVKKDRLVDQSSFIHANRHGREDLEAKGRRSDSHQIGGIRKECKNLPTRDGNDHLNLEQMFKHCSGS